MLHVAVGADMTWTRFLNLKWLETDMAVRKSRLHTGEIIKSIVSLFVTMSFID